MTIFCLFWTVKVRLQVRMSILLRRQISIRVHALTFEGQIDRWLRRPWYEVSPQAVLCEQKFCFTSDTLTILYTQETSTVQAQLLYLIHGTSLYIFPLKLRAQGRRSTCTIVVLCSPHCKVEVSSAWVHSVNTVFNVKALCLCAKYM